MPLKKMIDWANPNPFGPPVAQKESSKSVKKPAKRIVVGKKVERDPCWDYGKVMGPLNFPENMAQAEVKVQAPPPIIKVPEKEISVTSSDDPAYDLMTHTGIWSASGKNLINCAVECWATMRILETAKSWDTSQPPGKGVIGCARCVSRAKDPEFMKLLNGLFSSKIFDRVYKDRVFLNTNVPADEFMVYVTLLRTSDIFDKEKIKLVSEKFKIPYGSPLSVFLAHGPYKVNGDGINGEIQAYEEPHRPVSVNGVSIMNLVEMWNQQRNSTTICPMVGSQPNLWDQGGYKLGYATLWIPSNIRPHVIGNYSSTYVPKDFHQDRIYFYSLLKYHKHFTGKYPTYKEYVDIIYNFIINSRTTVNHI